MALCSDRLGDAGGTNIQRRFQIRSRLELGYPVLSLQSPPLRSPGENHVWEGRARDCWEDPCTADGLRERRSCPPGGRTWTQVHLTEAAGEPQLPAGNLSGYSWHLTRSCAVGTPRRPTHLFFLLHPAPPGEGIRMLAQLPQALSCPWARERQVADCPSSTWHGGSERVWGHTLVSIFPDPDKVHLAPEEQSFLF